MRYLNKIVKIIEAENGMVVTSGWEERKNRKLLLSECPQVSLRQNEHMLETYCTT